MKIAVKFNIDPQPGDILTKDIVTGNQYLVDDGGLLIPIINDSKFVLKVEEFKKGTVYNKINLRFLEDIGEFESPATIKFTVI